MNIAEIAIRESLRIDATLGTLKRIVLGEKSGIIVVFFHNIFMNNDELQSGLANPLEAMTLDTFKIFLEVWHRAGYKFISLRDILGGLHYNGKFLLITIDDGYRNLLNLIPILEHYNAHAVIFPISSFVEKGESFWSNIVYREETAQKKPPKSIRNLIEKLKGSSYASIEAFIRENYGTRARKQKGEVDRFLTADDLAILSEHPLIEIGNHTANHIDLTSCSESECYHNISECQYFIERLTGKRPIAISYPYGRFNKRVIELAKKAGLSFGFTCEEGRIDLPIHIDTMLMNRYNISGILPQGEQCERFRGNVSLFNVSTRNMLRGFGRFRHTLSDSHIFKRHI